MTTTCSQYKKITVMTDPENPEMDLVNKAEEYGQVQFKSTCSDGFVYLILINGEEKCRSCEEINKYAEVGLPITDIVRDHTCGK